MICQRVAWQYHFTRVNDRLIRFHLTRGYVCGMRFPRSTLTRFHIFLNKIANFLMSYLPFFLPSHLLFCPRHLAHQSQSSLNAQFLGAKHELKPERKKKKKPSLETNHILSCQKVYVCVSVHQQYNCMHVPEWYKQDRVQTHVCCKSESVCVVYVCVSAG